MCSAKYTIITLIKPGIVFMRRSKQNTNFRKLRDAADPIHATQPLVLTFHILGFSFNGAPFP